jgi:hypothetical protein
MKKSVLFAMAIGFGLASFAQNAKEYKRLPFAMDDAVGSPNKVVNSSANLKNGNNVAPTAICDTLGSAGNAYGSFTRGGRSLLAFDPNLNTLVYSHRSHPAMDATANTGFIMYDISTNGAQTWNNRIGPVYSAGAELARYPQGFIYNPPSNTNPANAFLGVYGPCTNGSGWVAHFNAGTSLGTLGATQDVFMFQPGLQGLIPYNGDQSQDGTVWIADMSYDGTDYLDTVYIRKGVWNTANGRYGFTTYPIYAPVSVDGNGAKNFGSCYSAFSANGQTGYMVMIAHDDFVNFPDSAYYLIVYKSTNAGVNWNLSKRICLGNLDSLMNGIGQGRYTTGFDLDCVVDMNGNLHMVTIGSEQTTGGWSVPSNSNKIAMHVWTTDGGSTWKARKLGETMTFRGSYGSTPISEDNRPQISTNWSRDRIFFTWFDTDTNTFGNQGNVFPDAFMAGYNVTTGMWSPAANKTTGSCADGLMLQGSVPQYVKSSSGTHTIFANYSLITDDLAPTNFRNFDAATITDASMTSTGSNVYLCYVFSVNEHTNNVFGVGNPYPNPANAITNFEISMLQSANVAVEVYNTVGQNVMNIMNQNLGAGKHIINMDASALEAGIYFISVRANGHTVTKKLTVTK